MTIECIESFRLKDFVRSELEGDLTIIGSGLRPQKTHLTTLTLSSNHLAIETIRINSIRSINLNRLFFADQSPGYKVLEHDFIHRVIELNARLSRPPKAYHSLLQPQLQHQPARQQKINESKHQERLFFLFR
jgi:hypothetical protein